jgi:hypothetical protein
MPSATKISLDSVVRTVAPTRASRSSEIERPVVEGLCIKMGRWVFKKLGAVPSKRSRTRVTREWRGAGVTPLVPCHGSGMLSIENTMTKEPPVSRARRARSISLRTCEETAAALDQMITSTLAVSIASSICCPKSMPSTTSRDHNQQRTPAPSSARLTASASSRS